MGVKFAKITVLYLSVMMANGAIMVKIYLTEIFQGIKAKRKVHTIFRIYLFRVLCLCLSSFVWNPKWWLCDKDAFPTKNTLKGLNYGISREESSEIWKEIVGPFVGSKAGWMAVETRRVS